MIHLTKLAIFPAFVFALVLPLLAWTNYYAWPDYLHAAVYGQFAAVFIMMSATILFFKSVPDGRVLNILFVLFAIYCFFSSVWSIDFYGSLENAIALGIYFVAFVSFWKQPEKMRENAFFYAVASFCVGTAILPIYLGLSSRSFGGVTANMIAHIGFTIIVLAHFGRRLVPFFTAIGIGLIIYAQGRTVLLSAIAFLIMYYGALPITYKFKARIASLSLIIYGSIIIGLFYSIFASAAVNNLSSVTSVENEARLGSDFTGRTGLWEQGLREWQHNFFLGNGFSTRGDIKISSGPDFNAHSGVLNLLLDLGFIGAILFIILYATAIYVSFNPKLGSNIPSVRTSAAFFIGYLPNFVVEPNYLSLYHPSSLALFFALTAICGIDGVNSKAGRRQTVGRQTAASLARR